MARFSRKKQFFGLVAWLLVAYSAAAIGGIASVSAGSFYAQLVRPAWAPPPYIFGPVWMTLYTLMGIASWLVWRVGGFAAASSALTLFLLQLASNALWTWLFFRWRHGAAAFVDVVLLFALIVATIVSFRRVSAPAGILLIPYLLWVAFASVLTYSLWHMNPRILG